MSAAPGKTAYGRHTVVIALLASLIGPQAAQAQEVTAEAEVLPTLAVDAEGAAEAEAAPPARSRLMEEIVVTAQKREENLQDVPISVQAFSADLLDARGIEEPKALQLVTPGLQYNLFGGYSIIYIRGIGTDAFLPSADGSVATYIDNIYFPFGHGLASALGSIERVEILKGPQGTLFGRNSTAGAINIVTKQPGPDLETSLLVTRESYDKTNFRAYTNIPVLDTVSVSLSALHYSEQSYYSLSPKSPRAGNKELPEEVSKAFAVKLGWSPTDDFEAVLGLTRLEATGGQPMILSVGDVTPLGAALGVERQPDYQTGEDGPVYIDSSSRVLTANLKYSTDWFDTRLIVGDQDIRSPALADFDGSTQPLVTFEVTGQYAEVTTAELQFLSNDSSWGSDWLNWIGGLYYISSSAGYDPVLFSVGPNAISFLTAPAIPGPLAGLLSQDAIRALAAPLNSIFAAVPGLGLLTDYANSGITLNLRGVLETKSTAGFFQATAEITDAIALTVGGRYQTETRKLVASQTRFQSADGQITPVFDFGNRQQDTSNFSPKAVLDYKWGDDALTYASFTKGFKSGTFNIITIYTPTQEIQPEEVTAYELGYKGTLLDGALRLNAAAFQNTIDNLQVQTISLTSGGAVRFENAGSGRVRGMDFDILWQVAPTALPGLVATAGGAYLDGKYTDYRNGSGFDETTGLFFGGTGGVIGGGVLPGRDFTGNKLVRTPKFSGNMGLAYSFDLLRGTFELASDVYYNSGSDFSAQNRATSRESSYHLINARASYFYEPWGTRLTAFGKNINNAKYHYVLGDLDFGTANVLAPPSTYGVKLQWEF